MANKCTCNPDCDCGSKWTISLGCMGLILTIFAIAFIAGCASIGIGDSVIKVNW